jgi:hypothetical protein
MGGNLIEIIHTRTGKSGSPPVETKIQHRPRFEAQGGGILDRNIQLLGLCNLQPAVEDILKRFGVIGETGGVKEFGGDPRREKPNKVLVFDSIEEGLACLIPA